MSGATWDLSSPSTILQFAQHNVALLSTVAILAATYIFIKRIQSTGKCPFAGASSTGQNSRSSTARQGGKSMSSNSTPGDVRLTLQELAAHDGSDASKPLYIAVRGKIYDVSAGRSFYGPGGPYAVFAGKECARALALMKVTAEDCSADLTGATEAQLQTLADWEAKFLQKYGVAGLLVQ